MFFKNLAWLALFSVAAQGAELPPLIFPEGVGVNIHFVTGRQRDLDLIAAAGFKFIRMDFGWEGIERKKGEYDWSAYEELTANLEKRGLRAVYILDYSHPLYEAGVSSRNALNPAQDQRGTASPQHPESIAAYARWAAAAAKHFHGRHVIWEIWNEPNGFFWKPKPDVQQYTALALAAAKAIREAEPDATIVGPALSGFEWPYFEAFLKSGVLEYLDAVSVHPYRSPRTPPETAAVDYQKLRGLIERYAPDAAKKKMPILSGEWGYSSAAGEVPLETQGDFAARQQLSNLLNGVPLSIWYDWKNDGADPKDHEQNFGTVTDNLQPKPAYLALQTLARELAGFRIERRLPLELLNDNALLCVNSAKAAKIAVWTTGARHQAMIYLPEAKAGRAAGVDEKGEPFSATIENGHMVLEISPAPKYITLPGKEEK